MPFSSKEQMKKWRLENRDRIRAVQKAYRLKREYGLSLESYKEKERQQNNRCWICYGEGDNNGKLSVDHNHKTGLVRGLLCSRCNHGLGSFRENVSFLKRAVHYLEFYEYQRHNKTKKSRSFDFSCFKRN